MRWKPFLLVALLAGTTVPAEAQTEHGAFVMTLGKDTVAIDQYARTARFLDGALLVRSPVTRMTVSSVPWDRPVRVLPFPVAAMP